MIRPGIKRIFRLGGWRKDVVERDVDEEITLHLELRARELEAAGLTPEDARAEAWRRFGPMPGATHALRSTARRRRGWVRIREWLEGWAQDLRHTVRGLRHERAFTAFVVVTLALGIGANAAMFGVVDRLLLRGPEDVRDPGRVMRLYQTIHAPEIGTSTTSYFGYVTYASLKAGGHDFAGVGAAQQSLGMLGRGGEAREIRRWSATADYFSMLGVHAYRGRIFSSAEDATSGAQHVAVLGYGFWKATFGGDDAAIGKTLVLDDTSYVIVGVAPPGFTGTQLGPVDVWTPMSLIHPTPDWPHTWDAQWLEVYARLKPGVTAQQASLDATAVHRAVYDGPDSAEAHERQFVAPLSANASGSVSSDTRVSQWLLGVTLAVLLIACANVVNLQLARAVRRRRELAVRMALGAGRRRVIRLLLAEGMVLALTGGAAGLVVAVALARFVRGALLPGVAWARSSLDTRVLLVTFAITLLTGLLVGLLPAFRASRPDLTSDLKTGLGEGGGRRSRLRGMLTAAQAALATLLLVGAGLFVRSVQRVHGVDLGMRPDHVLVVFALREPYSYPDSLQAGVMARQRVLYRGLLPELRALPGVTDAAVTIGLPFETSFKVGLSVPGWDSLPKLPGGGPYISAVTAGYFDTMGMHLLRGRAFTSDDHEGTAPVAIVNATMARTLWPGKEAIGQCLDLGAYGSGTCSRVVGVVADAHREQIDELPAMQYYIPFGQEQGFGGTSILIRGSSPAALAQPVRRLLARLVPSVPYVRTQPLEDQLTPYYRSWDLGASIFSVCGLLALIVAGVGLYSVMSYLVAQRRHEFGVRVALGARSGDLLRLVLTSGLSTAMFGIVLGLVGAALAGRWLEPLLFHTSARDPVIYAVVAIALAGVALAASLGPGLRAGRADPLDALRVE